MHHELLRIFAVLVDAKQLVNFDHLSAVVVVAKKNNIGTFCKDCCNLNAVRTALRHLYFILFHFFHLFYLFYLCTVFAIQAINFIITWVSG